MFKNVTATLLVLATLASGVVGREFIIVSDSGGDVKFKAIIDSVRLGEEASDFKLSFEPDGSVTTANNKNKFRVYSTKVDMMAQCEASGVLAKKDEPAAKAVNIHIKHKGLWGWLPGAGDTQGLINMDCGCREGITVECTYTRHPGDKMSKRIGCKNEEKCK